jgi:hypothetical protein
MLGADSSDDADTVSLPVVYLVDNDSSLHPAERMVFPPAPVPLVNDPEIKRRILTLFHDRSLSWKPLPGQSKSQIERFLFPLVDAIHSPSEDRDARVRQTILRLWNSHTPDCLPL